MKVKKPEVTKQQPNINARTYDFPKNDGQYELKSDMLAH